MVEHLFVTMYWLTLDAGLDPPAKLWLVWRKHFGYPVDAIILESTSTPKHVGLTSHAIRQSSNDRGPGASTPPNE